MRYDFSPLRLHGLVYLNSLLATLNIRQSLRENLNPNGIITIPLSKLSDDTSNDSQVPPSGTVLTLPPVCKDLGYSNLSFFYLY